MIFGDGALIPLRPLYHCPTVCLKKNKISLKIFSFFKTEQLPCRCQLQAGGGHQAALQPQRAVPHHSGKNLLLLISKQDFKDSSTATFPLAKSRAVHRIKLSFDIQ
jgi:hypothetical protein